MDKTKITSATAFLRRPRTAADLATHLGTSRPTAYAVIRAVGAKKFDAVRQGAKGPLAARFQITP